MDRDQDPFKGRFDLDEPSAWVSFPGGELQGKRPNLMSLGCRTCRQGPNTICFRCFRAELDRKRAMQAAANLDTASEARFQSQSPFPRVNRGRLAVLKADRARDRRVAASSAGRARRQHAQIAARHALQRIAVELRARGSGLRLPEAWLPFVRSGRQ